MELAACIACSILFIAYTEAALIMARRSMPDKVLAALFGLAFPGAWFVHIYTLFGVSSGIPNIACVVLWPLLTILVLWHTTGHAGWAVCGIIIGDVACVTVAVVGSTLMPSASRQSIFVIAVLTWHACVAAGLFRWARSVRKARGAARSYCIDCNYSLLGLPPSTTRCPECGADIPVRPSTVTHN